MQTSKQQVKFGSDGLTSSREKKLNTKKIPKEIFSVAHRSFNLTVLVKKDPRCYEKKYLMIK
jgi:hypothetical protein